MCFCDQMQCMSHHYKVIVCRAYCIDAEYAIYMLLVKTVKIIGKKSSPQAKYREFDLPRFFLQITISIC